jgi:2-isopropylmalate synthase
MEYSGRGRLGNSHGMQKGPITKYRAYPSIDLSDRQWPARTIVSAPTWCSVDLRDGNQALPIPMGIIEKTEMFKLLVDIGFKEIEVAFPSASQTDFDFVRHLIEGGCIPDDVTIQVLVPAREEHIQRTIDAVRGAKNVIIHLYNSVSPQQRRIVFGMEKPEIIALATRATHAIKDRLPELAGSNVTFEYTPESFVLTEVDFALEICEAVIAVWEPTREKKIILNLPETVEVATPNVHADQIEWICRHLRQRDTAIISVHTHNDRGTGVAAAELGLLAGAERIEGTLFGNGERTGNVDLVTLALNMYMQGIDPGLNLSNLPVIRDIYEKCTHMSVPARQPYIGELVFTAFSGSHQDAIRKGMLAQATQPDALWEVPYLPIDPQDIGQTYEAIIRINSQSGKGGVAYLLENECGLRLPKEMQIEFGKVIKVLTDRTGEELSSQQLLQAFEKEYLHREEPYRIEQFCSEGNVATIVSCTVRLNRDSISCEIHGQGTNPLDAFMQALKQEDITDFKLNSYTEHTLATDSGEQIVAYVQIGTAAGGIFFGVGIDTDRERAAACAVLSALNRSLAVERVITSPAG